MAIFFPRTPARYTQHTTVAFDADWDGAHVICEISAEALDDHFGAADLTADSLIEAFGKNRGIIEAAAREVLPQRAPMGRCLLLTTDF